MMTPFDTNLMSHTADKHRHLSEAERIAHAEQRRRALSSFRAFVALVFASAPRHGVVLPKIPASTQ
ncbi:MAG: hypothetical protein OEZ19_10245 [Paracoccaceae bacterium]|nr:hypothetical protein [Paracoccaceae bacterium]